MWGAEFFGPNSGDHHLVRVRSTESARGGCDGRDGHVAATRVLLVARTAAAPRRVFLTARTAGLSSEPNSLRADWHRPLCSSCASVGVVVAAVERAATTIAAALSALGVASRGQDWPMCVRAHPRGAAVSSGRTCGVSGPEGLLQRPHGRVAVSDRLGVVA